MGKSVAILVGESDSISSRKVMDSYVYFVKHTSVTCVCTASVIFVRHFKKFDSFL